MKIDWSKWSSIAEILSSVAIVVTLIYLVIQTQQLQIQTQQNTDALLASIRQASLDTELEFLYEVVDRPFLAGASQGYNENEFSEEQVRQYRLISVALFRMRESQWLQHKGGALDSNIWQSYRSVLLSGLKDPDRPLFRATWDEYSSAFDPGFREDIESRLDN